MLNKKGFALPTVLGTFVFLTSLVAGLFILVMNTTLFIVRDAETSEDDFRGRNSINVFLDSVESTGTIDDIFLERLNLEKEIGFNQIDIIYTKINNQEIRGRIILGGDEFQDTLDSIIAAGNLDITMFATEMPSGNARSYTSNVLVISNEENLTLSNGNRIEALNEAIIFIDGNLTISIQSRFTITGTIWVRGNFIVDRGGNADLQINGEVRVFGEYLNTGSNQNVVVLNNTPGITFGEFQEGNQEGENIILIVRP